MRGVIPALPFWKMEGCGNDFAVIYRRDLPADAGPSYAITLCDRRRGVGADGVLVVGTRDELDAVARGVGAAGSMEVWNADGSVAEMCGNGVRCVVLRLVQDGWVEPERAAIPLLTGAGIVWTTRADGEVSVDMGPPRALPRDALPEHVDAAGLRVPFYRVSMGNPHAVIFTDDGGPAWPDLSVLGREIERAPEFPDRTNVELATILDEHTIRLRVWERGVGETLACGSGACATVVAACRSGRLPVSAARKGVDLLLPGGRLRVEWAGRDGDPLSLRGPARTVFHGTWRRTT